MTDERADTTQVEQEAPAEHEAQADQDPQAEQDAPQLSTADLAGRAESRSDDAVDGRTDRTEPAEDDRSVPLLSGDDSERFRGRWGEIQVGFVDEPREMVERADELVAELMQRLAAQFSDERSRLETQWDKQDDVSTEDLRVALQRYRSFFERLLSA